MLPIDHRAPARKHALEHAAHELHVPIPKGFHASTPVVGKGARRLIVEVELAARLPVTGEFDGALLAYLFPPPTVPQLRANVVGVGLWGNRHASMIGYDQGPSRDFGFHRPPLTLPLEPLDCSAWTILAYFWAGVPASHSPQGAARGYRTPVGNTDTILEASRQLSGIRAAQLADFIVWGYRDRTHHVAFVIGDAGTADPLLSSHGREACPCAVRFSDENRAQDLPYTVLTSLGGRS